MKLADSPAFACPHSPIDNDADGSFGMTYRQWLAGLAMQGLCAKGHISATSDVPYMAGKTAEDAVIMADAVIAQLERTPVK